MKYILFPLLFSVMFCAPTLVKAQGNPKTAYNDSLLFHTMKKEFKIINLLLENSLHRAQNRLDSVQNLLNNARYGVNLYRIEINRLRKKQADYDELKKIQFALEDKLNRAEDQRDSVQKLLNNSRYRERRYRIEATRLKKILENSEDKLDSLQKAYNEIASASGTTLAEYRKQVIQLTNERNNLASENQWLQARLARLDTNSKDPLFALTMKATPGQIKRNQFSPQFRSRNVDRVLVSFRLTRVPNIQEQLMIKLFDGTNFEIPLKPASYQKGKANTMIQSFIIEPDIITPRKFILGRYAVRLFFTDLKKGITQQSIGIAEFTLR